ncbi:helix-turn-helix transcriptional regulator [Oxalobacteraceae bacterium R-40]|uniref:Helix-turn-helix transcriptional regulator n=1 Tax=Keguizhuia sedimenti TaxID=3064264 RepID=A0ABU1BKY5_9BURK|nr:helix-turn-helix transcriptional regulator [Oxalobacteraceae bacterium R-40]
MYDMKENQIATDSRPKRAFNGIERGYTCNDPDHLLDMLKALKDLQNDAALSHALQVAPPIISKIRNGRMNISPGMLLRIHDVFGIPLADLRKLLTEEHVPDSGRG